MKVLIDTNVLVFWFQREHSGIQTEPEHDLVIQWMQEQKAQQNDLYIPAPAFAEFCAVDVQERQQRLGLLANRLSSVVVPYDARSAQIAGALYRAYAEKRNIRIKDKEKPRVKTDIAIMAIAITMNMDSIVTYDKKDFVGKPGGESQSIFAAASHLVNKQIIKRIPKINEAIPQNPQQNLKLVSNP